MIERQPKHKAVIIYSGGMDSFTLLHELLADSMDVHALSFNYGQRHAKELVYAEHVCAINNVKHEIVQMADIGNQLLGNSSQTSKDIPVPEGHYEEESMKQTVVPNRNMIMLSMAMGYAINIGANSVYYGAHAGDHAIYPDCRPEFVAAMNQVGFVCDYKPITIVTPYMSLSKGDIAVRGVELGLDYSQSWTCYNGRLQPCGKCGACQERLEAMEFAGIEDPLEYES